MPKLYLSGGNLKIPEGGRVHVQYSYGAFFKSGGDVRGGLADAVNEGRQALDETITYMQQKGTNGLESTFRRLSFRYLKTDFTGLSQQEFDTILSVLKLTHTGINNSNLSIKVFNKRGATRGYVRNYFNDTASKSHHTPGKHNPGDGSLQDAFKGDIHMSVGGITAKPLIAAKIFVHEATHKFANTADFGEKGYTSDDTAAFRDTGLTREQALMNAESYGRFAVHFYRQKNGLPID